MPTKKALEISFGLSPKVAAPPPLNACAALAIPIAPAIRAVSISRRLRQVGLYASRLLRLEERPALWLHQRDRRTRTDFRFNSAGNRITGRHDLIDRGSGLAAPAILAEIHDHVSSATYRTDAAQSGGVMPDFYAPKIQPGSIRSGTVLYDINGHVAIVYAVESDGRVLYMSADPDATVTRSVYGAQFGQGSAALGGGFKNFRPVKLVGATLKNGAYVGGRLAIAANSDIADFSLEQYRGNKADATGDGPDAMFYYRDAPVDLFQYVRGAMSGGTYVFDPVYELKAGIDKLCQSLQERSKYVDAAIQAGIDKKNEPDFLPGNIYASENEEWEAYATPSRDASLKNSFSQLYVDLMKFIFAASTRIPAGSRKPLSSATFRKPMTKRP
jgi:hypothetical protein